MEKNKIINKVRTILGIDKLIKKGDVYLVGGIVRDLFLNKSSKDIDLVVCKIEFIELKNILEKYGRVDVVGESFGILKYTPKGWKDDEPIDIALPRTERKTGLGHKDFDTISDPFLPIEVELERRDFTINAMAMDMKGNLIDPFNGAMSLASGKLEHVSDQAFSDDPLRMLRGIQFASRFDFSFVNSTWRMIQENSADIKHITGERILTELDKVFMKGNKLQGLSLLKDSGLADVIFPNFKLSELHRVPLCVTREDFISFLVKDGDEFKKILKGDVDTAKGIDAINIVRDGVLNISNGTEEDLKTTSKGELRRIIFNAQKKSSSVLESGLVNNNSKLSDILKEFSDGKMPRSVNELALNGKDLMELGLVGKQIGDAQQLMLNSVLSEELVNTRESLESLFKNV